MLEKPDTICLEFGKLVVVELNGGILTDASESFLSQQVCQLARERKSLEIQHWINCRHAIAFSIILYYLVTFSIYNSLFIYEDRLLLKNPAFYVFHNPKLYTVLMETIRNLPFCKVLTKFLTTRHSFAENKRSVAVA